MIVSETEPHKGTTRWYQWRIAQLEQDYSKLKEVSDTCASDWFRAMDALRESEFDKNALTQERDELRLTVGRQAKIIANHQHASTKSESFALPAIILSVICGALCGGAIVSRLALPPIPAPLVITGIVVFVLVAVAVLLVNAMSSSAASLDPPANGEEEAL